MANEPTYEFPLSQNSYAAFDAISLRNLIIQRLNDQGNFTDQNYIGSNLASIIDIISYSFNTLLYYLNKTSTESMFTEAQLYENINRIVKLLDYKPVGYQTSSLAFSCSADNSFSKGIYTIPRYTYLMVAGAPFSFNEDVTFSIPEDNVATALSDLANKKLLYQGMYRENPIYTATGDKDEVVLINVTNASIDHYNIDVYVYEKAVGKWIKYDNVPNLYSEYAQSRSFEKRLNSNGLYEITFGNNINGRQLQSGDRVAVYFLQSSGELGIIGPRALQNVNSIVPFSTTIFTQSILPDVNLEQYTYMSGAEIKGLSFDNQSGSTLVKDIENADSIRKNAPITFKTQYRLITINDFQTFIQTNFANFVSDVKVFSNWEYTGQYLKYFHEIGLNPGGFQQVMLNQVLFADSCNFNNIYVCGVPRVSQGSSLKYLLPAQKQLISSNLEPLKILTSEITFLDPIYKALNFGPKTNDPVVISDVETYILEIVKRKSNQRTARSIQQEVASIFKDFFNPVNIKLGTIIDYALLTSKILSVDGVSRMATRNSDSSVVYQGLSFYLWNPVYQDLDKQAIVNNLVLGDFEFLYFENLSTIETRIVVTES
jgi:hypothetical protein